MNQYITIEMDKSKAKVGYLCAEGIEDAYEQMGANVPRETEETLVIPAYSVNQLIIDLNKMKRKL